MHQVPILCAHGDTVLYPTAVVKLQTGLLKRKGRVVVAANLSVDVLLGMDLYKASMFREGQVEQWCQMQTPEWWGSGSSLTLAWQKLENYLNGARQRNLEDGSTFSTRMDLHYESSTGISLYLYNFCLNHESQPSQQIHGSGLSTYLMPHFRQVVSSSGESPSSSLSLELDRCRDQCCFS